MSAVCLGNYYAEVSVFNAPKNEAGDFVMEWIASNKNRFLPDSTPCYGKF